MGAPSKAKRPKRRWVGIRTIEEIDRENLKSLINQIMPSSSAKLYDLKIVNGENLAIVRINLAEYRIFVSNCEADNRLETITTSGKIRLVRDRLCLPKPKLRR
tara:strand:+ start:19780 stop:20088 length:309 start_codon:yes stop_codon:yes gene_type:complete